MTSATPAPLPTATAEAGRGEQRPRIVVGVDGSPGGAAALAFALRQAQLQDATLEAVGCWVLPALNGAAGYGAYVDPSAFQLGGVTADMLDASIADAVGKLPGGETVTVQTHVVEGHPARSLLRVAEHADLLVVGSRGHGELSGMLLGSVGLHCVSHATCPVVVVRHPRDEA